jgi:hypothetical protein
MKTRGIRMRRTTPTTRVSSARDVRRDPVGARSSVIIPSWKNSRMMTKLPAVLDGQPDKRLGSWRHSSTANRSGQVQSVVRRCGMVTRNSLLLMIL